MATLQKTRRIFEFIKGSILLTGEAPTIREIGEEFNMSSSASVHAHLKKMETQGWIKRTPHVERGIEVVEQEQNKAA
jgi:repressor LexA